MTSAHLIMPQHYANSPPVLPDDVCISDVSAQATSVLKFNHCAQVLGPVKGEGEAPAEPGSSSRSAGSLAGRLALPRAVPHSAEFAAHLVISAAQVQRAM